MFPIGAELTTLYHWAVRGETKRTNENDHDNDNDNDNDDDDDDDDDDDNDIYL